MKICIASDAWSPQVNGVVNTLSKTKEYLESQGHEVLMITPNFLGLILLISLFNLSRSLASFIF